MHMNTDVNFIWLETTSITTKMFQLFLASMACRITALAQSYSNDRKHYFPNTA